VNIAPGSATGSERGIRILDQAVHHDGARLAELVQLVDAGRLTLRVAETFPLAEVAARHELAAGWPARSRGARPLTPPPRSRFICTVCGGR